MKDRPFTQAAYRSPEGIVKESDTSPGRLIRLLQSALLMDLLSCALLTSGLGAAVLTLTDIDYGFLSCFGIACAAMLVIAAFSMKWWLAPAAVAASAAAAGLYLGLTGKFMAAVSYGAGFAGWALAAARSDETYRDNGGAETLQCIVIFAVALLCFVLIRKLFSLPVLLFGTGAGLGAIYYLGRADLSVPLCAAFGGIVILLPRVYARYVGRRSKSAGNRGAMQIVAVPAALLAVLLPLLLVPEDTSAWRSRGLVDFVADAVYFFQGPFRSYPAGASNFSMRRLGLEREDGKLGGPAQLTDERYLTVTAARPLLLRGAVADFYTGTGWQVGGADGDFRLESLFWRSYRRSAFGLGKPSGGEARRLFESLTTEQDFTVAYRGNRFSTVFAGGILHDAEFANNMISEPIYFNMRSELYLHYLIPHWVQLQLNARVWNTETAGFEESFLLLEQLAADRGDKSFSQIGQRYTQLPDNLPESVTGLARDITAGSESPYQRAVAIARWLQENCTYTLTPVVPPENTDFVGHFLDTRQGYCTYYASAMAVLARCAGLPARYVTGFGLERETADKPVFLATGKSAHAWAEIYFDGIGWVEFDPLNWNAEEPLNSEQAVLPDLQVQPARPSPSSDGNGGADENIPQNASAQGGWSLRQGLSFIASVAAAYFMLHLAVRRMMRRKLSAYELARVSRKIPDLRKRIDFYFDDILRQLSFLGLEPYAGETLTDFSERVDRRIQLDGKRFADIAETRAHLHFANAAPTGTDCEYAFRYHHALELLLRERMHKTAYFFKRAVR